MKEPAFLTNAERLTAHAFHVGDRINTIGFEGEELSAAPFSVRLGKDGIAVLFRYGAVVLIGTSPGDQLDFLEKLASRVSGKLSPYEEEAVSVKLSSGTEDQSPVGGPILVKVMSLERLLVVADVLAKSVVLAHDEREVARVFEVIEPFARELALHGRTHRKRTAILKLIGNALLVQHRVSVRVAVTEKPDALWDRPDLERLYARLEDEYELQERVDALNRKLSLVAETARTLADIIDTRRSLRLEIIIVLLIAFEVVVTLYQLGQKLTH